MSKKEISTRVRKLQELEAFIVELKEEANTLRDEIKDEMVSRDLEELDLGDCIVRYTTVISNRFDMTAFKKKYNDMYHAFTKQITNKRFQIC